MPSPDEHQNTKESQPSYDQYYYDHYSSESAVPYGRVEPWLSMFGTVAENIVTHIHPQSVLDVGCAKGLLVEALRDRGVEASGVDISEYAINQVRDDIQPFCRVGSALAPFPMKYDLLVCIEVLEHVPKADAQLAVANLCRHGHDILFSSSPDDFTELTHFNVQPVEYWSELFAYQGFYRDVDFDASFIAEHAVRYRKAINPIPVVVRGYDRKFWLLSREASAQRRKNVEISQTVQQLENQLEHVETVCQGLRKEMGTRLQESAFACEKLESQLSLQRQESETECLSLDEDIQQWRRLADERLAIVNFIQESLGWKALEGFRKSKDLLFPPTTRRRILAQKILRVLKKGLVIGRRALATTDSVHRSATLPAVGGREESSEQDPLSVNNDHDGTWSNLVLLISGSSGDMERYRCHHPQEQLFLNGIHVHVLRADEIGTGDVATDYALVILHRIPMCEVVERIINRVREQQAIVLFDIDDLVFDPDQVDHIDAIRHLSQQEQVLFNNSVRGYRATLEACDGVIVSTESLARAVETLGKPAWVHRNSPSLELMNIAKKAIRSVKRNQEKVIIGYASGTKSHNRDFQEVQEALQRILERYPQVELRIIGHLDLDESWKKWQSRIRHLAFVPWKELSVLVAEFDINLAPLQPDNPFCEGKSELKYLEAAIVQVPTIASKVGAYEVAIRHGENGLLAEDAEGWYLALEQLITGPVFRANVGRRAKEDVLDRYHPARQGLRLLDTFDEVVQQLRGKVSLLEECVPMASEGDSKLSHEEETSQTYTFPEHQLAHTLLDGLSGLEIGAASHNSFGLNTRNVALPYGYDVYEEYQETHSGCEPVHVDIWAGADDIPVPNHSEDFILSSHVIEHVPNVIQTFLEWNRIVRHEGYVFMIVPLKGALPADEPRELTPFSHFLHDYQKGLTLETHSVEDVPGGKAGHYHTFTPDTMEEIVKWMHMKRLCNWEVVAREDIDTKVGNGFTLVFKVRHA